MKEKNLLFYLLMISSCARNWGVSIVNNEKFSRYGLGVSNQFFGPIGWEKTRLASIFFKNRTSKSKRMGKKNGLFTFFLCDHLLLL